MPEPVFDGFLGAPTLKYALGGKLIARGKALYIVQKFPEFRNIAGLTQAIPKDGGIGFGIERKTGLEIADADTGIFDFQGELPASEHVAVEVSEDGQENTPLLKK